MGRDVSAVNEMGVVLTIGAVAHQLGVAVPTLRSWDRRYGLGPSEHVAGSHRRYTPDDLARLRHMLTLTSEGVPPGVAARLALDSPRLQESMRDGGGSGAVAVGRADRAVRGLARAATRLDGRTLCSRVAAHIRQRGVRRTWDELLVPLLQTLGEQFDQDTGGRVIGVEHVATTAIVAALHECPLAPERGRIPALLACAPEEQHSLPLEALQASLAERHTASRFLGARVPEPTLISAVRQLAPRSVTVWSHAPRTARKIDLVALAQECPQLVLAGPGWSAIRPARDHPQPSCLQEAIQVLTEVAAVR